MKTHYEALGVSPTASHLDIKQAYHAALLRLHPDKQHPDNVSSREGASIGEDAAAALMAVHAAWKVLKDPELRSAYDGSLANAEWMAEVAISDRLSVADMDLKLEDGMQVLSHSCRCGGAFLVLSEDVPTNSAVIVGCDTCSSHIEVYNRVGESH